MLDHSSGTGRPMRSDNGTNGGGSGPKSGAKAAIAAFIKAYKYPDGMSIPHRLAHCLLGLSKVAPGDVATWQQLTKAVLGLPKIPPVRASNVYGAMAKARLIARGAHGCTLISGLGGARASFNPDDQARNGVEPRAKRVVSAQRQLAGELEILDPSKIKDPALRARMQNDVLPINQLIAANNHMVRLLPPGTKPPRDTRVADLIAGAKKKPMGGDSK